MEQGHKEQKGRVSSPLSSPRMLGSSRQLGDNIKLLIPVWMLRTASLTLGTGKT